MAKIIKFKKRGKKGVFCKIWQRFVKNTQGVNPKFDSNQRAWERPGGKNMFND